MIRNCISKKANHLPYMLLTFLVFVTASVYAASPWDPADVKLKSHQLKTDVYAVLPHDAFDKDHVATTAGFIIGDKGVLVIESMVNGHLASQLIGEIRKVTTKPIRYLVNTSYHGDHSYGNFKFPKDTGRSVSSLNFRLRYLRLVKFPMDSGRLVSLFCLKLSTFRLVKFAIDSGRLVSFPLSKLSSIRFVNSKMDSGNSVKLQ